MPLKQLLLLLTLAMLFACGSKEKARTAKVSEYSKFIAAEKANRTDFRWYSTRLKAKVEGNGQKLSGTINLKLRKDSLIWASVSAVLGIEVARAQISPDSVYVLNRLNNTWSTHDFKWVNQYIKLKNVNFQNLQNIILGQPPFELNRKYTFESDSNGIQLEAVQDSINEKIGFHPLQFKVENYLLEKPANHLSLNLQYPAYANVEGRYLPSELNMKVRNPEAFSLDLRMLAQRFKNYESVTFGIPSHYEQVH